VPDELLDHDDDELLDDDGVYDVYDVREGELLDDDECEPQSPPPIDPPVSARAAPSAHASATITTHANRMRRA
jgi:hypothetical protein